MSVNAVLGKASYENMPLMHLCKSSFSNDMWFLCNAKLKF